MKEPIHHYMQVGIVHFVVYPCIDGDGPILETVHKICSDPYFDVIEISWIHDQAVRSQVKNMLETSGIHVTYCAHPWLLTQKLDLNSEDSAHREAAIKVVKEAIEDAAEYGVKCVALLSGAYTGMSDRAAAINRLADSLQQICQYANQYNIEIVLEIFDQEIDKKRLIGKTTDAVELAEKVCSICDNFGLMVDLSHLPLLGETAEQALLPVQSYLKHVHLGNCYIGDRDNPAWGDVHPRFGYPGSENDVEQIVDFLQVLFEIGYLQEDDARRPIVSFEVKPVGQEDPELVIANAKRKLNAAWAKLELHSPKVDKALTEVG
ncbi:MAG TPA: sugar phosphate isomerase/epimerase family protein [Bacilli bacterium]